VLAGYLLRELNLVRYFGLNTVKLDRFLAEIELGYDVCVPYHNRSHAASVLHFMHALLSQGRVAEAAVHALPDIADPERCRNLVILASFFAAIVHDHGHTGFTNDFLVKNFDNRALRHNDSSVNERHHAASAFEVLHQPECNFLEGLPVAEYRQFRSLVIELVLSTDAAQHDKVLGPFRDLLTTASSSQQQCGSLPALEGAACDLRAPFTPSNKKDAVLTLQVAIKCADLGHLALNWNSHLRWVRRLEEEFFAQGDREKESKLHDVVSFLMDREKPGVTKTQVGFMRLFVLPLFHTLVDAFPHAQPMLAAATANLHMWQAVEDDMQ